MGIQIADAGVQQTHHSNIGGESLRCSSVGTVRKGVYGAIIVSRVGTAVSLLIPILTVLDVVYREEDPWPLCFSPHLVSAEPLRAAGIRGAGEKGQRLRPRLPRVVEGGKHTCDGSQEGDCVHRRLWDAGMPADSVPKISPLPRCEHRQEILWVGSDAGTLRQDFAKFGS